MQIIRFVDIHGQTGWGRRKDDIHAYPLLNSIFAPWCFGDRPVRIARVLAPIDPPNILAIGRNYREHAMEMKAEEIPEEPLIFLKATTSVIGPGEPICLPVSAPDEVDYEAELAVIIGRCARNVTEQEAPAHILGFTCANDVTARDCQRRRDKQWARAKSFDTFCPLGPVIVAPDEFDWQNTGIRLRLNGNVMQDSRTAEMIFSVPKLISYLSHQFTLPAGTLILTGTPSGVGAARKPPVFLKPGDELCVEIDGIGRLVNPVMASR